MMAHLEQQDMSFTALETIAAEKLIGTMHSNLEENGVMCSGNGTGTKQEIVIEERKGTMHSNIQENCSSNGIDVGQELLLLHGESHKDTNAVEELSQSLEGIAIETMNKALVDIDQVNDCTERCAQHSINNLVVAALNNGVVAMEAENGSKVKNEEEVYSTKPSTIRTLEVLKGQRPASPKTFVKCATQTVTQSKHVHEETDNGKPLKKLLNSKNKINHLSPSCSSTTKASSSKFTIARPFALATDRRAEERPAATVANCPSDFPQDVKNLRQKFFVAKSSHSNNNKCSVSEDLKVPTSAMGFNFRSDERAKKRKEFYSKLQEKYNAKEEEKTQIQARTEKEDEEALKVLRRSLTFKASPMPSFYQEGPPPQTEPKKIPTTQPKSPKFTSRSSRIDSNSVSNGVSEVEYSQSNGLQWHLESVVDVLHQSKELLTKRLVKCSLLDLPSQQISNSNANNEVAHAADEMNKRNCEETPCESALTTSNQKHNEGAKARQMAKGAVTKASSERHERFQGKCGSNVLRNCANKSPTMSSSMSNKMKPKVQQSLPYDMKEDLSPKTNKTTKKERLKALTPYFRKRDSIGSVRQSTAILTERVAVDLVGT